MAKGLSKSKIIAGISEEAEITKKQAACALEALVNMAYKGAKDGFTIPGLGKLVKVKRKARMGRNPATGETIKIPAKTVLKFRIAKAAKDAVLA
ncbi:MAG: HU family DNA-binding protein [Lentisphaerales bacterium]|jgi:DNA-binding protein HU-beta|nr:MAG: HU family DNA-binding protein [Lentisphaerales bacterium]